VVASVLAAKIQTAYAYIVKTHRVEEVACYQDHVQHLLEFSV
jgi:hypothetical protein